MAFCSHPKYDAYVFLSAIDVRSTSTWDSSSMRDAWARDEGGHRHRWENLGPRCSAMDRTGLLHLTSPHRMGGKPQLGRQVSSFRPSGIGQD